MGPGVLAGATTVDGVRGAADADGPRSLVDDGEATGAHAASAINAATETETKTATLVGCRRFVGAANEDSSTLALPSS